jgi:hypothetical protein
MLAEMGNCILSEELHSIAFILCGWGWRVRRTRPTNRGKAREGAGRHPQEGAFGEHALPTTRTQEGAGRGRGHTQQVGRARRARQPNAERRRKAREGIRREARSANTPYQQPERGKAYAGRRVRRTRPTNRGKAGRRGKARSANTPYQSELV